jgi:hypothetical protein
MNYAPKYEDTPPKPIPPEPCPDCGATLIRQGGCLVCVNCGYAPCA